MEKLEELKKTLSTNVQTISIDLSKEESCFTLYEEVKNEDIDILINNAGFGIFGAFDEINIHDELRMIDTNIKSVDILTKLFLKDFKRKNSGYI
jgi:short-subunit dehydrogenase